MPDTRSAAELLARITADRKAAAAPPTARVKATTYTVSLLPEDDVSFPVYMITIEDRGGDRWAVTRHSMCLGADGDWEFGVKPYDRGDDWLNSHRFDLETAIALAREAAPGVVVNNITALQAFARSKEPTP
jgi:hypothetical protein